MQIFLEEGSIRSNVAYFWLLPFNLPFLPMKQFYGWLVDVCFPAYYMNITVKNLIIYLEEVKLVSWVENGCAPANTEGFENS